MFEGSGFDPTTAKGIKHTRLALGLSQTKFAYELGRLNPLKQAPTGYMVSRWELGKATPSQQYVIALLRARKKAEERVAWSS